MFRLFRSWLVAIVFAVVASVAYANPVNVNTSDAETLAETMSGVGITKARAIVAYRDSNGPFSSLDDLVEVKGIGTAIVDRNRDKVTVNATTNR